MIKEDVLNALSTLGFIPQQKENEDSLYFFNYKGLKIIYLSEEDDTQCISFSIIYGSEILKNGPMKYDTVIELCNTIRYVQPTFPDSDYVQINYFHYVVNNEVTPQLIEHIIDTLAFANSYINKIVEDKDNGEQTID